MEKDNFKDRPIESTLVNKVKINDLVYVCIKPMQKWASDIDDLHFGVVKEILTKHNHPRGIKVKIVTYINPNEKRNLSNAIPINGDCYIGHEVIGRVVYTTKNGVIDRK